MEELLHNIPALQRPGRGPIYKISYDLSYDNRKIVIRYFVNWAPGP